MKNTIFTGAGVAIVTPMNQDGTINYNQLTKLIDWQIEHKTDAIVICGTTGEPSTMTTEEHLECIRVAVEAVRGRVPVIAGAGGNDTANAIWKSKQAKELGADALLHVTPYYNKTSQKGLVAHFNAIADATDLPIIAYSVPARTGMSIRPETYLELSKHPNIVAAKEASGDFSSIAAMAALCGDNLDFYSGNDDQIIPLMSLGAKGVISVSSNIIPEETHDICQLYLDGKVKEAAELQLRNIDLIQALFCDVSPIPVKEALNMMGMQAGPCRLPLYPLDEACKERLTAVMRAHQLI